MKGIHWVDLMAKNLAAKLVNLSAAMTVALLDGNLAGASVVTRVVRKAVLMVVTKVVL